MKMVCYSYHYIFRLPETNIQYSYSISQNPIRRHQVFIELSTKLQSHYPETSSLCILRGGGLYQPLPLTLHGLDLVVPQPQTPTCKLSGHSPWCVLSTGLLNPWLKILFRNLQGVLWGSADLINEMHGRTAVSILDPQTHLSLKNEHQLSQLIHRQQAKKGRKKEKSHKHN